MDVLCINAARFHAVVEQAREVGLDCQSLCQYALRAVEVFGDTSSDLWTDADVIQALAADSFGLANRNTMVKAI